MADDKDEDRNRGSSPAREDSDNHNNTSPSLVLRSIFLGNLHLGYSTDHVRSIFEKPEQPPAAKDAGDYYDPIPVSRVDVKRSYCFVFLKDAESQEHKAQIERFVSNINGMNVPNVSANLRAEFARGDGRVKRKEDERKKVIAPSETLFVVNFNEAKTKREDLQMLFEPFGELIRIDMKKNYAFVQFRTIDQATKAKTNTDGGKLDQAVLTVEYVARQRDTDRAGSTHNREDRSASFDRRRRNMDYERRGGGGRDRYHHYPPDDRRYDYDRYDDRYRGRGGPPSSGSRRGPRSSRSRSRSPPYRGGGYRDRSPPGSSSSRGGGSGRYHHPPPYDTPPSSGYHHRGGRGRSYSPPPADDRYYSSSRRSPDYDRDRGYRS